MTVSDWVVIGGALAALIYGVSGLVALSDSANRGVRDWLFTTVGFGSLFIGVLGFIGALFWAVFLFIHWRLTT